MKICIFRCVVALVIFVFATLWAMWQWKHLIIYPMFNNIYALSLLISIGTADYFVARKMLYGKRK